ncbi:MAG: DUF423 domain-containing protein [Gammaproteobacteria bacterium]|nr:DUF423 domain-containing protein [Gammaproteobacteria bacterium]MCY4358956.1 DUF423 domain-containing protein [Gammaproteobacteria bacterium]
MSRSVIFVAALSGFLAVALGAFAAHGLETLLNPDLLATFHTGVDYHMSHSLALLGTGILLHFFPKNRTLQTSAIAFLLGIIVFSGSLYLLSLSGIRWIGAVTPIGGVAFLVGWVSVASFAWALDR